jgi:hypothetical protein
MPEASGEKVPPQGFFEDYIGMAATRLRHSHERGSIGGTIMI